ncbi:hypothetical protein [Calothrix sp. NIES-3974]|nr:hypothetical protein [Calothrix sp. NIES-3974]
MILGLSRNNQLRSQVVMIFPREERKCDRLTAELLTIILSLKLENEV